MAIRMATRIDRVEAISAGELGDARGGRESGRGGKRADCVRHGCSGFQGASERDAMEESPGRFKIGWKLMQYS